jgi:hypothetical protein
MRAATVTWAEAGLRPWFSPAKNGEVEEWGGLACWRSDEKSDAMRHHEAARLAAVGGGRGAFDDAPDFFDAGGSFAEAAESLLTAFVVGNSKT